MLHQHILQLTSLNWFFKLNLRSIGPTSWGAQCLTFHPDGDVGAAVVPPRTLGGKKVSSRGAEPVPVLRQLGVTDRGVPPNTEVVVEAPLRLVGDDLVEDAGIAARYQPEGWNDFYKMVIGRNHFLKIQSWNKANEFLLTDLSLYLLPADLHIS